MRTPRYESRTIAPGGIARIGAYGKYLTVLTITASRILLGIDDEPPQEIMAGVHFPIDQPYQQLVLVNAGDVASTVVLYIAETPVFLSHDSIFIEMAASLAAIDADTDALALMLDELLTHLPILSEILVELRGNTSEALYDDEVTLAAATATMILLPDETRIGTVVSAKKSNAASVFLGSDILLTDEHWMIELQPGERYSWHDYQGAVYAYSVDGGDKVGAGSWINMLPE